MGRLDTLVVDHLSRRLFTAKQLTEMLISLSERRANRAAEVDGRVATLQREVSEAEDKLKRLYKMVEDGIAEMDDILEDADRQPEARPGALDRIRATAAPAADRHRKPSNGSDA